MGITYERFEELAKEHYEEGGDTYYECWGQEEFDEYVNEFGELTETKFLNMIKEKYMMEKEYDAARRWYSGEDF